jgi:DNA-binding transcriptional ArsR family regulator
VKGKNKKENQCPTKRHHLAKLNNKKIIHLEGERERGRKKNQCVIKRHDLAKLNNKKIIHLEGERERKKTNV